jgi:hypothetical protein
MSSAMGVMVAMTWPIRVAGRPRPQQPQKKADRGVIPRQPRNAGPCWFLAVRVLRRDASVSSSPGPRRPQFHSDLRAFGVHAGRGHAGHARSTSAGSAASPAALTAAFPAALSSLSFSLPNPLAANGRLLRGGGGVPGERACRLWPAMASFGNGFRLLRGRLFRCGAAGAASVRASPTDHRLRLLLDLAVSASPVGFGSR